MAGDTVMRPWRTPRLPDLVGAQEAREILAVAPATLKSWQARAFMIPAKRIAAGPVWVRSDVEEFADDIRRQLAAGVAHKRLVKPARPWRTERLPDLAGMREATEILDRNKVTIARWMTADSGTLGRDRTFMIPAKRIAAGPVWVRDDLRRFGRALATAPGGDGVATRPRAVRHAWPWRTSRMPEIVGREEVCELLGISLDELDRWMLPGSGDRGSEGTYMIPARHLTSGPIWSRSDVERFARQRRDETLTPSD